MIYKELEKITIEEKMKGTPTVYIRNLLKEYLQIYVLYFIYTSSNYNKNLIFTGGTCLRQFFGLERLSEDIDFDYLKKFNSIGLQQDIEDFFKVRYLCEEISASLKQQGRQILLKFPFLHQLGLARAHESNLLYIKIDLSKNSSKNYSLLTTSKSKYGFNFAAKHYDLSTLMAGKLHAILTRRHLTGKDDRLTIKGRDYFDLLWFVKNSVNPNLKRLSDLLNKKIFLVELEKQIDKQVKRLTARYKDDFVSDLQPLVANADAVKSYVDNYYDEYSRYKPQSFRGLLPNRIYNTRGI